MRGSGLRGEADASRFCYINKGRSVPARPRLSMFGRHYQGRPENEDLIFFKYTEFWTPSDLYVR